MFRVDREGKRGSRKRGGERGEGKERREQASTPKGFL